MPRYEPDLLSHPEEVDQKRLTEYLQSELRKIAGTFTLVDEGRTDALGSSPAKPREGQLVYADGVSWDPGSGAGYYYYTGTAWVCIARLGRNLLINGSFRTNQRAPATNADDTYAHDRWYALTQTGTIAVTTRTGAENATPYMARLTQSQAVAQRMGYAQIIEGKNCRHLRGAKVSFGFRVALSSTDNIRVAIMEWTGAEDAVTSDVVLTWTSTTYTANNFFLAASVTPTSVTQKALTGGALTDVKVEGVTLGTSFNNLIVFVWTENAVAQNVTLDLGRMQLEAGGACTEFQRRHITESLLLCQRYYCVTAAGFRTYTEDGYVGTNFVFPVTMRAAPTGTFLAQGNTNFVNVPAAAGFLSITVYSGPYQYSLQGIGATYYDYGATAKFDIEL